MNRRQERDGVVFEQLSEVDEGELFDWDDGCWCGRPWCPYCTWGDESVAYYTKVK